MDRSASSSEVQTRVVPPVSVVSPVSPRAEERVPAEVDHASRAERAALLGSIAAFLAVASAAALSTMEEIVRAPALVTFFASLALAVWARRVLRSPDAKRPEQ